MSADRVHIDSRLRSVCVSLEGREVGTLAQTADGPLAFSYSDSWLRDGFSISPLSLPLERRVFIADPYPLEGVFGVFADSLPDGWGRFLVDRTLKAHGFDPASIGALARLSIVGSSGMGALEYQPENTLECGLGLTDLDRIANECATLLATNHADDLDALFAMGGSSGGARPKVLVTVDGEDWIIKFPASVDPADIGTEEYRIAQLACRCGIDMPMTRLFASKTCGGYFGARRFDRARGQDGQMHKIHMVSAAGLLETSHRIPNLDYETLMKITWRLTDSIEDVERLFKLMCFNVRIGNRDDHSKNFSYLCDPTTGSWTLSPAYDLTNCAGMNGEHATTVNGKGRDIVREDLIVVGVDAGIKRKRAEELAGQIMNEA